MPYRHLCSVSTNQQRLHNRQNHVAQKIVHTKCLVNFLFILLLSVQKHSEHEIIDDNRQPLAIPQFFSDQQAVKGNNGWLNQIVTFLYLEIFSLSVRIYVDGLAQRDTIACHSSTHLTRIRCTFLLLTIIS